MKDSDSISKNYFVVIREREDFFPLSVILRLYTKPKNESHMFNKETTETNRETAEEKNNLARDGLRVQLTENKDSCKKSVI